MSEIKLNKIERLKAKKQASEYRSELALVEWNNLDEEQRFYLKNFGIYNIKLRPESFMIRIRIDAGHIAFETLKKIAEIEITPITQIIKIVRLGCFRKVSMRVLTVL